MAHGLLKRESNVSYTNFDTRTSARRQNKKVDGRLLGRKLGYPIARSPSEQQRGGIMKRACCRVCQSV